MIRYSVIDVRVNELHTQRLSVPEWEVAMLNAVHPGSVEHVDTVMVPRETPSAADEYQRLGRRYGVERETQVSYVSMVYGQYEAGVRALTAAIKEATVKELPESKPASRRGRPPKAAKTDDASSDTGSEFFDEVAG